MAAEILDIQLMVEIAYGTEPLFSATVPRFRRFAGDEGHRVLGQGLTPALALEDFHHKLFAIVVGEEDKVETVHAPPLERVEEAGHVHAVVDANLKDGTEFCSCGAWREPGKGWQETREP